MRCFTTLCIFHQSIRSAITLTCIGLYESSLLSETTDTHASPMSPFTDALQPTPNTVCVFLSHPHTNSTQPGSETEKRLQVYVPTQDHRWAGTSPTTTTCPATQQSRTKECVTHKRKDMTSHCKGRQQTAAFFILLSCQAVVSEQLSHPAHHTWMENKLFSRTQTEPCFKKRWWSRQNCNYVVAGQWLITWSTDDE